MKWNGMIDINVHISIRRQANMMCTYIIEMKHNSVQSQYTLYIEYKP